MQQHNDCNSELTMYALRDTKRHNDYIQDATGGCTWTNDCRKAMLYYDLDTAERMADRINEPSFGHVFSVEVVPVALPGLNSEKPDETGKIRELP